MKSHIAALTCLMLSVSIVATSAHAETFGGWLHSDEGDSLSHTTRQSATGTLILGAVVTVVAILVVVLAKEEIPMIQAEAAQLIAARGQDIGQSPLMRRCLTASREALAKKLGAERTEKLSDTQIAALILAATAGAR